MHRRTILTAIGLVVVCIFLLIYLRNALFDSQTALSDSQAEIESSRPDDAQAASDSRIVDVQSPRPTSTAQLLERIGRSDTVLNAPPVSPAEVSSLYYVLTETTNTEANQLFIDCFWLMDNGRYREARSELEAFLDGRPLQKNEFMAPAWWMLAWSILNEGGKENLLDAADKFQFYANVWPDQGDYEALTKAAILNRAIIYTDLSYTAHGEEWYAYIGHAKDAFDTFLAKWPEDPQSFEVRNLLDNLLRTH